MAPVNTQLVRAWEQHEIASCIRDKAKTRGCRGERRGRGGSLRDGQALEVDQLALRKRWRRRWNGLRRVVEEEDLVAVYIEAIFQR